MAGTSPPLLTSYTVYSLESRCVDIIRDFPALRESALAAVRAAGDVQGVVGVAEGCVDASVEGLGRATKRKTGTAEGFEGNEDGRQGIRGYQPQHE